MKKRLSALEIRIGGTYGKLTVLDFLSKERWGKKVSYANCQCECGNIKEVLKNHLCTGEVSSCGCIRKQIVNDIDQLTGTKINNLTILGESLGKDGRRLVNVKCDCGELRNYRLKDILNNKSTSCGCQTSVKLSSKAREFSNVDDVIGLKVNKLTVIKGYYVFNKRLNSNEMRVDLKCDCGNTMINKSYSNFKNKLVLSCGCSKSNVNYNYHFFKNYSKERNYIIGLLASDGCLEKTKNTIRLELQERDIKVLKTISNLLLGRERLTSRQPTKTSQRAYLLRISNADIYNNLLSLGLYPAKSQTYVVPEEFKNCSHFWRGILDGDGWVSFKDNNSGYLKIGVCGTRSVCESFQEFINNNGIVSKNKLDCNNSDKYSFEFCKFTISGEKAKKICELLYNDKDDFYIERKYENYQLSLKDKNDSKNI